MIERDLTLNREAVFTTVETEINQEPEILSALIYGSSLLQWGKNPDVDVAIIVNSDRGVVEPETYLRLKLMRTRLCEQTDCDIDLITHTEDEVKDPNSPLHAPRYFPSLTYGRHIKHEFPVPQKITVMQNATAGVMHDNRTITRRQLLRENSPEHWRIFISKLAHGPGNALVYRYLMGEYDKLVNPSDVEGCFEKLDELMGIDSSGIQETFDEANNHLGFGNIDFNTGVMMVNWYEALFAKTLYE